MAEKFVVKGDYEKALKEYEAALKLFPKVTPGERTVFNMGLIWSHPDNPKRDCKKSAMYFQQVLRDFPNSRLSKEAGIWAYMIDELISCESKSKTLEKSVDGLKKKITENQRIVDTLKEIDIGVEEKKRERLSR
ncbi:MAG: hypothetical protein SV775_06525 [Thermodesulfobacteriota bacterium]|nr:hypothetical protein [Thermodesulfobacteriota bacterium]